MKTCRLFLFMIALVMFLGAGIKPAQAIEPKIAAGGDHTVVLKKDGTLWAWGLNFSCQLGDGGIASSRNTPVQIGTDTDWKAVAAGYGHTIALKTDGTLWAWGDLLRDVAEYQCVPLQIGTDTDWTDVAAGANFNLALKAGVVTPSDKTLWAWGGNSNGQLGDDSTTTRNAPVPILPGTTWTAIAGGGSHAIGLQTGGTLWAWGYNGHGQLGDGTYSDKHVPTQILPGTTWSAVAGGQYHSIAVKTDGTLWTWGNNDNGQLGVGFPDTSNIPVQIGSAATWTTVAAGNWHTLARKVETDLRTSLWSWGLNGYGQLGLGSTDEQHAPVQIPGITWTTVEAGGYFTIGLKEDGTLWAWGMNTAGQLGDGTNVDKHEPVQIMNLFHDTLTVTKTGTGSGTVTSVHTGIDCGADCSEEYDYNAVVTLNAAPAANSIFLGWSGGNCTGTGECVVTMDNNKTIIASFQRPFYWPMFLPAITRGTR